MAKRKLAPTPVKMFTTVRYVGDVEALKGTTHTVDSDIKDKGAFIEQQYQLHLDRLAAEEAKAAELKAAEEQALAAAEARAQAITEAPSPEPVVEPLAGAPQGDAQEQLALAASLSNVTGSLLTQAREVEALQQQVATLLATTEALMDQINAAGIAKSEALDLVKSAQTMMSGLAQSTSIQIEGMQSAIRAANDEAQVYRSTMLEHVELVDRASRITDAAVDIAKQTAQDEVDQMWDQFVASTNAVLVAAGVGRNQFLQILNSGMVQGEQAVIASREELATYVNLMRATSAAQDQTDENITIGASQMRKQKLENQIGGQTISS